MLFINAPFEELQRSLLEAVIWSGVAAPVSVGVLSRWRKTLFSISCCARVRRKWLLTKTRSLNQWEVKVANICCALLLAGRPSCISSGIYRTNKALHQETWEWPSHWLKEWSQPRLKARRSWCLCVCAVTDERLMVGWKAGYCLHCIPF